MLVGFELLQLPCPYMRAEYCSDNLQGQSAIGEGNLLSTPRSAIGPDRPTAGRSETTLTLLTPFTGAYLIAGGGMAKKTKTNKES